MLKNLIIKCSDLVNRDDISLTLKNVSSLDEIENQNIQSDIIRLIQYYNFTISNIYENYIDAYTSEEIVSNQDGDIFYSDLKYTPLNIVSVSSNFSENNICKSPTKIETNSPNTTFKITYKYEPNQIMDLNDEITLPLGINQKVVIYSIVSEFLASKDSFEKSEHYKNKFLFEIFKFKTKKERFLKQTFYLWNKIQNTFFFQILMNQLQIML